jgi:thiol-disulfide isomerase/thioredoxin
MKLITHLFILVVVFSLNADEKSEKLLDLAGFSSHSSKNLELNGFGSGFAITSDGYIVTASHVTEGCDAVRVIFKDGKSYDAKVVKEEEALDLAILKIEASSPNFLSVASRTASLGDDIYTIGYPSPLILGSNQKFTKGSISALTGLKNNSFRYQISVPIQPGNSGGPIVSERTGEVIGIVVSSLRGKEVVGFNPQSVNYALKSAFIRPILDELGIEEEKAKNIGSSDDRRQRVIDAVCMIVTCKLEIKEDDRMEGRLESKEFSYIDELLTGPLLNSSGEEVSKDVLKGKTIGIYFSAHWCPPCRGFTPSLVEFRDKNKKDFEVVFVSSDKSPDAQMKYMKEMNMKWYTLPHRSEHANKLARKYEVHGIPTLVIVSPNGEMVTKNGRLDVSSNPSGAIQSWAKF